MRLREVDIDGYGVFAGETIGPFVDGVNIVVGENEAGKSTLLDFIRGVLYGFATGTSKKRQHLPLGGGRHGGRLVLHGQDGRSVTIERHGRTLAVRGDKEAEAGEAALRDLVGHTDKRVFESIFAFGLSDLERVDSLTEAEVREVVFSAGVVGAGRSASSAIKALEDERQEITRTAKGKNAANSLFERRSELERALGEARQAASGVGSLARELSRKEGEVEAAFARFQQLGTRKEELRDLEVSSSLRARRRELERSFAELEVPRDEDSLAAGRDEEIRALIQRHDGYLGARAEEERTLRELAETRQALEAHLEATGMSETECEHTTITIEISTKAGELVEQRRALERRQERLANDERIARDDLAESRRIEAELLSGAPPDEESTLERRIGEVANLRSSLVELDREENKLALVRQQAETIRAVTPKPNGASPYIFLAVVLLGVAVALFGLRSGQVSLAVTALGALVVFLGVAGLVATLQRGRRPMLRDAPEQEHESDALLTAIHDRIRELAKGLALPDRPTIGDLDANEQLLRAALAKRGQLERAISDRQSKETKWKRCSDDLAAQRTRAFELDSAAMALAALLGIDREISPTGLMALIEETRAVRTGLERANLLRTAIERYREVIDTYEREIASLAECLGRTPPYPDAILPTLEQLAVVAKVANEQLEARAKLTGEIQRLDEQRDMILRRHGDVSRLEAELEHRTENELVAELVELDGKLDEAKWVHGEAVRATEELRREIRELEGSTSIAELELELDATKTEIERVLTRYAVLASSSLLLRRTLSRYEQERQPAVIARASELLSEVTAGRYHQVLTHEVGQHPSFEVRRPDGSALDSEFLSSGTAQLLYLCVRVAYAEDFARRATSLPLIFDDVLVNLDPKRQAAMASAIGAVAARHQILVFTCHPNIVDTFEAIGHPVNVIRLPPRG